MRLGRSKAGLSNTAIYFPQKYRFIIKFFHPQADTELNSLRSQAA
jgi:hypothetical protein